MSRKMLIKSMDEYASGVLICLIGGIVYSVVGLILLFYLSLTGDGGWIGLIPLGFGIISLVGWIGSRFKHRWGVILLIIGNILNPISIKAALRVIRAIKFMEEVNEQFERYLDDKIKHLDSDSALYKQSPSPASTPHKSDKCMNCGQKVPYRSDRCPHCGVLR